MIMKGDHPSGLPMQMPSLLLMYFSICPILFSPLPLLKIGNTNFADFESCFRLFLTNLSDCFLIPTFCVSTAYAKIISVNICSFCASEFEQEKKKFSSSQLIEQLHMHCFICGEETRGHKQPSTQIHPKLYNYFSQCLLPIIAFDLTKTLSYHSYVHL